MLIKLYAIDKPLAEAWRTEFRLKPLPGTYEVEIIEGDILEDSHEAVVSPANSFGYMDGGIDLLYTEFFGRELQKRLQDVIMHSYGGELMVGHAVTIPTDNLQIPWLISAPTMRTPQDLNGTVGAYLASKVAVRTAIVKGFGSIAFPGMGTGVGALPPNVAAVQMRRGFLDAIQGMVPVSCLWERALDEKNLAAGNDTRGVHISEMVG
jgi:O-acetyl-ADP-ribose deacetylase (regulator of RNase III)